MRVIGQAAVLVGIVSLAVGVYSRWVFEPILRLQAHAFLGFAQACFLLAIALFVGQERG